MSNKKSSIEFLWDELKPFLPANYTVDESVKIISILKQAKAKYEHEICVFADEYASYVLEQSKSGIKGAMVSMCAWTFFKNRRNEQQ